MLSRQMVQQNKKAGWACTHQHTSTTAHQHTTTSMRTRSSGMKLSPSSRCALLQSMAARLFHRLRTQR
jgi:hypothetical protein